MCQIPVFSWVTATVLEHVLRTCQSEPLPQTLTELYTNFLLVQTHRKRKYGAESSSSELSTADCELLLKLGRLAFEQLQKGNIMFYQEDLEQVGLDLSEAVVYSGLCTEIFKRESVFNQSVYCFIHLSLQEFMAAVYVHHCLNNNKTELEEDDEAMKISLAVDTGHFDLFTRFLHGLSVETNQRLLGPLLSPIKTAEDMIQKVVKNLKEMSLMDIFPDRSINIFHCLVEMNDQSVQQQIQDFLNSGDQSQPLSEIQCSALAYMLQMSEQVLEELNLNKYNTTREGRWRLIPVVRNCRKALLSECALTETHCEVVASALNSNPSVLRELDFSGNFFLGDTGVKALSAGLQSPHCAVEVLRFEKIKDCMLTWHSCHSLASALWFNPSHLKELDLSDNFLRDSGVEELSVLLQSPHLHLQILRSLLQFFGSQLFLSGQRSAVEPVSSKELELSYNELQDPAVETLCQFLQAPLCALQILGLRYCRLTALSCTALAPALKPSQITALDLSDNVLLDSGVEQLCAFLQTPGCELQTLRSVSEVYCWFYHVLSKMFGLVLFCLLSRCGLTDLGVSALTSALESNPSHFRVLDLSKNPGLTDSGVTRLCDFLKNPLSRLETLRSSCGLSDLSCEHLASALKAHSSPTLKDLDLRKIQVTSAGIRELRDFQRKPGHRLRSDTFCQSSKFYI
uniref:Uncharacterized protein n=1 Tax=Neogobius melanostomus TaxID=47308 RepID=A0A8C6SUN1_9GOBI